MPSPLSLVQRADLDVGTGLFVYIRLLGDREAVDALTPTLDHIVIDRSGQVAADAEAIGLLRQRSRWWRSSTTPSRGTPPRRSGSSRR